MTVIFIYFYYYIIHYIIIITLLHHSTVRVYKKIILLLQHGKASKTRRIFFSLHLQSDVRERLWSLISPYLAEN